MISVMNTSDLPSFGDESSGKTRVCGGSDGVNGGREDFSQQVSVDSDNKVETRVSDDSGGESGKMEFNRVSPEVDSRVRKGKVVKLTMREDEFAKLSSGTTDEDTKRTDFDSAYAMVDEGAAARMSEAFGSEAEKALSYGFEPGDMVWGKVKSHPWWPGHVFNEAFVAPSVRRTKREGHVLVAFFGDSSYGWFDPAELIPFEPHYAEKSRQTSSKSFLKAVHEAIDEASRRCALGLTCRCRNPFNFRPTNVRSYFAVDVGGYEPGALYSVMQIKKARERFQPTDALHYVKQLALMPTSFDRNIDAVKNKATIFAYRKAAFEEFDETYAQAFGMQPVRPSREELDQIAKMPIRAPLSGPMVLAEALGEKKSTVKSTKVKEQLKKEKYLFKRRDELNETRSSNVTEGHEGITVSSASSKEGAAAMAPGDFVLQKRTALSTGTEVPVKQDGIGTITRGDSLGLHGEGADSVDRKSVAANLKLVDPQVNMSHVGFPAVVDSVAYSDISASQHTFGDARLHLDKEDVLNRRMTSGGAVGSTSVDLDSSSGKSDMTGVVHSSSKTSLPDDAMFDSKSESSKFCGKLEDLEPHDQIFSMATDDADQVLERANDRDVLESVATPRLPIESKSPVMLPHMSGDGLKKKIKGLKRPAVDLDSERAFVAEKKKKKKKESQSETSSEHTHKRLRKSNEDDILRKSAGKSIGIGLPPSENSQLDMQWRNSGPSSTFLSSDSASPVQKDDLGNIEVELPQIVNDLLALALDPFYGVERNSASVVLQVLLRFRSLVYQKSLVLSPVSEGEALESYIGKPPTSSTVAEIPSGQDFSRGQAPKQPKHLPRPDDPTKAGRKRSLSDRQEEMSAKRLKKLNELKSMTAERKASSQKIPEVQREQKDASISAPAKPVKLDSAKKLESPAKLAEPGMLVLKFPESTSLPSSAELKARFGRFGPLDYSAMRIFWKSNTCRVVFKHKAHAQAAYNYAVRNNALFGHVKVNYQLRDVGGQAPSEAESAKWQANGASDDVRQFRPPIGGSDSIPGPGTGTGTGPRPRPMTPVQQQQRSRQANSQLKSCLKKPSGEEVGSSVSVPREVPRVKFMLGGEEERNRGEQLMGSSSKDPNNTGGTGADGGASSIAMDVNSKNLQKVIPQTLPPVSVLPFPPRVHEGRPVNIEPINFNNYFNTTTSSNNRNIDISHQMLNLLRKCNDIVTDVNCSLGYVPYHPL